MKRFLGEGSRLWRTIAGGIAVGAFALSSTMAHAVDFQPTPVEGPTVSIDGDSFAGTAVGRTNILSDGLDERGGAALRVLSTTPANDITSLSINNVTVSGWETTITYDYDGMANPAAATGNDNNSYGPLIVSGDMFGATTTALTGAQTISGLTLTDNKTRMIIQDDSGTSNVSGGAGRILDLPELNYSGGTVSGNLAEVFIDDATATGATINTGTGENAHANGGGLSIESQWTSVTNVSGVTFSGNEAKVSKDAAAPTNALNAGSAARGGALYLISTNDEQKETGWTAADNTGMTATIADTTFSGNKATNEGAGIAGGGAVATELAVKATFNNVTFDSNTASSTGGAAQGGAVRIVPSNSLGSGTPYEGTLTGYDVNDSGGGYVDAAMAVFNNSTFTGNTATGAVAAGGAIFTTATIMVSGTTFTGNTANGNANAIHLDNTARVYFNDAAGSTSTDNDGISGGTIGSFGILKFGLGDLELFGDYTSYLGDVALVEGTTYFKGGATQVFSGNLYVNVANTLSLERGSDVVTFDTIVLNSGAAVVSKVLNAGDGSGTASTAHFVAGTTLTATHADNVYKVAGQMVENEQYDIIKTAAGARDAVGAGTNNLGTVTGGLFNDYTVYSNASDDAVWAEMVAGSARTLDGYAWTPNNRALAAATQATPGSDLYNYLVNSGLGAADVDSLNRVYELANNEIGASTVSALLGFTQRASLQILDQSRDAWSAWRGNAVDSRGAYGSLRDCGTTTARIWAEFDGYFNKGRDNDSTFRGKTRSWGVAVGADWLIGDWLIGGGFRYGDGRLKVDHLMSRSDFDSYSFSIYGGRRIRMNPGTLYLTGGYSYGFHDIDSRRRDIGLGNYKADYDGRSHTAFLDAAFGIMPGSNVEFLPFANVMYNSFRNDSYTEKRSGGVSDALHVRARTQDNFSTSLGVRMKGTFGCFFADASLAWRHTYGNLTPKNSTNFVGFNNRFTVLGNALARDEAVYGVGVGYNFNERASVRAGYDGSFGKKTYTHRGSISFDLKF